MEGCPPVVVDDARNVPGQLALSSHADSATVCVSVYQVFDLGYKRVYCGVGGLGDGKVELLAPDLAIAHEGGGKPVFSFKQHGAGALFLAPPRDIGKVFSEFIKAQKNATRGFKYSVDGFKYTQIWQVSSQLGIPIPADLFFIYPTLPFTEGWLKWRLDAYSWFICRHSGLRNYKELANAIEWNQFTGAKPPLWDLGMVVITCAFTDYFARCNNYLPDEMYVASERRTMPVENFSSEYWLGSGDCEDLSNMSYMAIKYFQKMKLSDSVLKKYQTMMSYYVPCCLLGKAVKVGIEASVARRIKSQHIFSETIDRICKRGFYHMHGALIPLAQFCKMVDVEPEKQHNTCFWSAVPEFVKTKLHSLYLEGTFPIFPDRHFCTCDKYDAECYECLSTSMTPAWVLMEENGLVDGAVEMYTGSYVLFSSYLVDNDIGEHVRFMAVKDGKVGVFDTSLTAGDVRLVPVGGSVKQLFPCAKFLRRFEMPRPALVPCRRAVAGSCPVFRSKWTSPSHKGHTGKGRYATIMDIGDNPPESVELVHEALMHAVGGAGRHVKVLSCSPASLCGSYMVVCYQFC